MLVSIFIMIAISIVISGIIAFFEVRFFDSPRLASGETINAGGDSFNEKYQPSLSRHLDTQQNDLKRILDILGNNADLEALLLSALQKKSRTNKVRHFITTLIGNIASVITGWLLSTFVNPITILHFVFHR